MQRVAIPAIVAVLLSASSTLAQAQYPARPSMGGGFIEFLFGDRAPAQRYQSQPAPQLAPTYGPPAPQPAFAQPQQPSVYAQPPQGGQYAQPPGPAYLEPQSEPMPIYPPVNGYGAPRVTRA